MPVNFFSRFRRTSASLMSCIAGEGANVIYKCAEGSGLVSKLADPVDAFLR